jgi:hypothetical protein
MRATANGQPLDDVDAVDFGVAARDRRQIPAERWGWAAHTPATVQRPAPGQDAADRTHRRHHGHRPLNQRGVNRVRPELAEIARLLQLVSNPEHEILEHPRDASCRARPRRAIRPVHLLECTAPRPPHPQLDGGETYSALPRGLPQPAAGPDGRHEAAPPSRRVFLIIRSLPPVTLSPSYRPEGIGISVTGRY